MRVPHVIELNTQEAYKPSAQSLKCLGEVNRKIRTENLTWDDQLIVPLSTLALREIARNFDKNPILNELIPLDREHLLELLSTDLRLEQAIPLIDDDYYWKRRYLDKFGSSILKTHFGWNWKCLYIERHVRKMCEEAESQYKDEETFAPLLRLCADYVHILEITQLRHWKPPKTLLLSQWPEIFPVTHISFVPILEYLPNLTELEICYSEKNVGESFEFPIFKMAPEDCEHLGAAILLLKRLRVLRLHRSGVECAHIKALVQKLVENTTLIELDLSHCYIGDLGAKCIAKLLNLHAKLKILNLRDNIIGEEGALGLGWALWNPEGTALQHLDLSLNPLGHEGTMAILRALIRGSPPQKLSLGSCRIRGITAIRLAAMLALNKSLRNLDISGNNIGAEGGQAILEALENNAYLVKLDMRNTNIPEDIQTNITTKLKDNIKRSVSMEENKEFTYFALRLLNIYGDELRTTSSREGSQLLTLD